MQKLLSEYGVIRIVARFLKPLLLLLGNPAKTEFLGIVANILGIAYGAAVMIDESKSGKDHQRQRRIRKKLDEIGRMIREKQETKL